MYIALKKYFYLTHFETNKLPQDFNLSPLTFENHLTKFELLYGRFLFVIYLCSIKMIPLKGCPIQHFSNHWNQDSNVRISY